MGVKTRQWTSAPRICCERVVILVQPVRPHKRRNPRSALHRPSPGGKPTWRRDLFLRRHRVHIPGLPYRVHDPARPHPPLVTPAAQSGGAPSSDAIVLFSGQDLSKWTAGRQPWKVENGYVEVVPNAGNLTSKDSFGDVQLHVEWAAPAVVRGTSQNRSNSGIFFQGEFPDSGARLVRESHLCRRPGWSNLRTMATAGESGAATWRVAVVRHRLRGATFQWLGPRVARVCHAVLQRRARAQPPGTDGRNSAPRARAIRTVAGGWPARAAGSPAAGPVSQHMDSQIASS